MTIGYAAANYVNMQNFNDNKLEIEQLLHDSNKDDKNNVLLVTYTADLKKDLDEILSDMIDTDSYDIYIASKDTFKSYKDKSVFADVDSYTDLTKKDYKTLKDSKGKVYAVSIEGNTFIKHFGFVNTQDLYIAAAEKTKKQDELPTRKKNGRNITKYIIENSDLYSR